MVKHYTDDTNPGSSGLNINLTDHMDMIFEPSLHKNSFNLINDNRITYLSQNSKSLRKERKIFEQ